MCLSLPYAPHAQLMHLSIATLRAGFRKWRVMWNFTALLVSMAAYVTGRVCVLRFRLGGALDKHEGWTAQTVNRRFDPPTPAQVSYIKQHYGSNGRASSMHNYIPRFGYSKVCTVLLCAHAFAHTAPQLFIDNFRSMTIFFCGQDMSALVTNGVGTINSFNTVPEYGVGIAILAGIGAIIAMLTFIAAIVFISCKCCCRSGITYLLRRACVRWCQADLWKLILCKRCVHNARLGQ